MPMKKVLWRGHNMVLASRNPSWSFANVGFILANDVRSISSYNLFYVEYVSSEAFDR